MDFLTVERDPNKRRVKPVEQACVLDFDEESSDDSDFRIEDHAEVSDDDDSLDSQGEGNRSGSEEDENEESDGSDLEDLTSLGLPNANGGSSIADVIHRAAIQSKLKLSEADAQLLICCACLGDHSDAINEIVECDSCGVTVHEACYGVSDSASLSSTDSLSPTAPWFCEACRAGAMDPKCELCPNSGGIFKETDVGKWVHLICALYVSGVAFGEVDKLTSVTLFEMPYSKWGAKSCSLCVDERFSRTGVCIGCDAGMCRTYFHVTCAQREGLLSEAHSEEVDQADPFYAHCKLHSDKALIKRRKRNYLALQLRTHYRKIQFEKEGHSETAEQVRIKRKLEKQKVHYFDHKKLKPIPWVPTQKMPRLITTSASACRKLLRKAELMGIDTLALEMQEAQSAALVDVRKKWHIPPAFTVEFIAYYLDRNDRLKDMKTSLEKLMDENKTLLEEQQELRGKYDEVLKKSSEVTNKTTEVKNTIHKYHSAILSACPTKNLPNIDELGKPIAAKQPQPVMVVPTAAALKMGVGFPLKNIPTGRTDRVLSSHATKPESLMLNECGICKQRRDQHLLAKCDTCHLYYHMDCLNPPLTRLPKKSKLYGWQCSECDKSSDSEIEQVKTPRRSRSLYSREKPEKFEPDTPPTPLLKIKSVNEINNEAKNSTLNIDIDKPPVKRQLNKSPDVDKPQSKKSGTEVVDKSKKLSEATTVVPQKKKKRQGSLRSSAEESLLSEDSAIESGPIKKSKKGQKHQTIASVENTSTPLNPKPTLPPQAVPTSPKKTLLVSGQQPPVTPTSRTGTDSDISPTIAPPFAEDGNQSVIGNGVGVEGFEGHKSAKKRRREKHEKHKNRNSPETGGSPSGKEYKEHAHKRKRKKKSVDVDIDESMPHPRITIKIKSIPLPEGEVASESNPQRFYVRKDDLVDAEAPAPPALVAVNVKLPPPAPLSPGKITAELRKTRKSKSPRTSLSEAPPTVPVITEKPEILPPPPPPKALPPRSPPKPAAPATSAGGAASTTSTGSDNCDVCTEIGIANNSVKCDECRKLYHFHCLDPPLKKSPKKRGYSWHCEDCDPTASE